MQYLDWPWLWRVYVRAYFYVYEKGCSQSQVMVSFFCWCLKRYLVLLVWGNCMFIALLGNAWAWALDKMRNPAVPVQVKSFHDGMHLLHALSKVIWRLAALVFSDCGHFGIWRGTCVHRHQPGTSHQIIYICIRIIALQVDVWLIWAKLNHAAIILHGSWPVVVRVSTFFIQIIIY